MACDLTTTLQSACASGIAKETNPLVLLQIIAQLTCELVDSGGVWAARFVRHAAHELAIFKFRYARAKSVGAV